MYRNVCLRRQSGASRHGWKSIPGVRQTFEGSKAPSQNSYLEEVEEGKDGSPTPRILPGGPGDGGDHGKYDIQPVTRAAKDAALRTTGTGNIPCGGLVRLRLVFAAHQAAPPCRSRSSGR